jgi:hypothetical protein
VLYLAASTSPSRARRVNEPNAELLDLLVRPAAHHARPFRDCSSAARDGQVRGARALAGESDLVAATNFSRCTVRYSRM